MGAGIQAGPKPMTRPEAGGPSGAEAVRHERLRAHFATCGYVPASPPVHVTTMTSAPAAA